METRSVSPIQGVGSPAAIRVASMLASAPKTRLATIVANE